MSRRARFSRTVRAVLTGFLAALFIPAAYLDLAMLVRP